MKLPIKILRNREDLQYLYQNLIVYIFKIRHLLKILHFYQLVLILLSIMTLSNLIRYSFYSYIK